MKKLSVLLLTALSVTVLLTGCGKKEEEPAKSPETEGIVLENENTEEPAEEQTEAPADDEKGPEGSVRSSITNEWIPEELEAQRPIAVMMPTDKAAQPQYGIGQAEVLYECMEEGSMSRQLAVINDWQELEQIGNIRSCRDYYIQWAMEWDPVLIHFGGVFYMRDRISRSDVENISGTYSDGTPETTAPGAGAFFRTKDRSAPHNAYVSASSVLNAMDNLGYQKEHRSSYEANHFKFAPSAAPNTLEGASGVIDAATIDLSDCFPVTKSSLKYSEADGVYYKSLYGQPQVDAATGEQLAFKNVIIQECYYEVLDAKGYLAFRVNDVESKGYYVTNGKAIPIRWEKTTDFGPTRYYDMAGNEIEINTGKTYIAVVQNDTTPVLK